MNKATPRKTLEDLHKVLGPEFVKQGQVLRELEEQIMSNIKEMNNGLVNSFDELGRVFTRGVSMPEFSKQCALIAEEFAIGFAEWLITDWHNDERWSIITDRKELLEIYKIEKKMNKKRIYLDDVRTPIDQDWTVVRNYEQFVDQVTYIGLENIELISLDHDLGPSAMQEWHSNVYHNYELNYDNIQEKTGMDCTKWLVNQWLDGAPVVDVVIHSANAIGSANMMGMINNYRHIHKLPQNCVRVRIEHTV